MKTQSITSTLRSARPKVHSTGGTPSAAFSLILFARQCVGMTVSQFERELRRRKMDLPRSPRRRCRSLRMLGLAAEKGRLVPAIVTPCPTRKAAQRLEWKPTCHPTHNLPLSLGIVGRY